MCIGPRSRKCKAHTRADTPQSIQNPTVVNPSASFIDVKARHAFLQGATKDERLLASIPKEFDCTAVKPLDPQLGEMVIPKRYLVGNSGAVDPEYTRISALYRDFEKQTATLGSMYVYTLKPVYAKCLIDQLAKWADGNALLNYDNAGGEKQPWFVAEWAAAAASTSYSLVMTEPSLDASKKTRILSWLNRVARKVV